MKSKILGLLAVGLLAGTPAGAVTVLTGSCLAGATCITGATALNVGGQLFNVDILYGYDGSDVAMNYFWGNQSGALAAANAFGAAITGGSYTGFLATGSAAAYGGALIVYGTGVTFPYAGYFVAPNGNVGVGDWYAANPWMRFTRTSVPEPGTLALLGLGLAGLGLSRRRKAN